MEVKHQAVRGVENFLKLGPIPINVPLFYPFAYESRLLTDRARSCPHDARLVIASMR